MILILGIQLPSSLISISFHIVFFYCIKSHILIITCFCSVQDSDVEECPWDTKANEEHNNIDCCEAEPDPSHKSLQKEL